MANRNRKKRKLSKKTSSPVVSKEKPSCGLCGKTMNLTLTECCGNWICNDEHKYQLFSYAPTSCHRNHNRYTLCGHHWNEGHEGDWKTCEKCREDIKSELYAYFGTNEYNFEKLKNPPPFEPTYCAKCKRVISLTLEGYSIKGGDYYCMDCSGFSF